jgi:hypothetical protein
MLINLSNHPSNLWSEKQTHLAIDQFGEVKDIAFPVIDPHWDEQKIYDLATQFFNEIMIEKTESHNAFAVHIMGEFNFVFAITSLLLKNKIQCVASTTQRKVTYDKHGNKISDFDFIQFRKYIAP